ncbi:hypothetical protein ACTWQB_17100 [Piscibacillus sp. B03]
MDGEFVLDKRELIKTSDKEIEKSHFLAFSQNEAEEIIDVLKQVAF